MYLELPLRLHELHLELFHGRSQLQDLLLVIGQRLGRVVRPRRTQRHGVAGMGDGRPRQRVALAPAKHEPAQIVLSM